LHGFFVRLRHTTLKAMTVCAVMALFFGAGVMGGHALADSGLVCSDRKVTQIGLARAGFAYAGTFIDSHNRVLQLYVSRAGAWVIIGITEDLKACILVTGKDHQLPFERPL
jgi:hypothetical protein